MLLADIDRDKKEVAALRDQGEKIAEELQISRCEIEENMRALR